MNSISNWLGLGFFVLILFGTFAGLNILSRKKKRTPEEFEKGAAESASLLSAGINALNGILNPEAGKGSRAVEEVQRRRYNKKRVEGKAIGRAQKEENDGKTD